MSKKETPLSDVTMQPIDPSIADPNRFHHNKTAVVEMGETLAAGQIPSNTVITGEIDDAARYLKEREHAQHSAADANLIKDVRKFVETAGETLEDKNRNDLAQKFVDDCALLAQRATTTSTTVPTEVIVEANKFLSASKNLVLAAVKSANFRKCLLDLVTVIRDIFERVDTKQLEAAIRNPNTGASDIADAAKDTLQDAKQQNQQSLPPSKRDVRADVRQLLQELNQHPESTQAFRSLMVLWNMLTQEFYVNLEKALTDADVSRTFDEGRQIIEAYAGGRSIELFLLRLRCVIGLIALDQDLRNYIQECQDYFQKALDDPTLVENDKYYDEGSQLFEKGKNFAKKYQNDPDFNAVLDEAQAIAEAMSNDEQMKKLSGKAEQIAKDLTYTGADGKTHLDTDFVPMIRNEIIPFLNNRIKEIPVPGFQLTSDEFHHLIVDDLYVTIDDLIPDRIKIRSENSAEIKPNSETDPLKSRALVEIKIDGVKIKVKDFYFNFKRKTIVGNVSDEGRADLKVAGDGLHVRIQYELLIDAKRNVPALQNAKVEVHLDNVSLDITEANHKTLLNMATSLFKAKIQKDVENTLKIKIEELGQDLADLLNKQVISNIAPGNLAGILKSNLLS